MHFAAAIAADWLNSRKLAGAVDPSNRTRLARFVELLHSPIGFSSGMMINSSVRSKRDCSVLEKGIGTGILGDMIPVTIQCQGNTG